MKFPLLASLLLLCVPMFTGCAIHKSVHPVQRGTKIQTIYVQHNDRVLMKECTNEIVSQLKTLGFDAVRYDGPRPPEAHHTLSYTGNWQWDMAMYLVYFQATLYEDGRELGTVSYDATRGGANMKKFGRTSEKMLPLLAQLLQDAERGSKSSPTATALGTPPPKAP
jgi:hypothetical protein